jgi:DinB superfamily
MPDFKNNAKRNHALAKRLKEVLLNGKWIANTNFKEQIESISWQQATQKVGGLNTIAALTFHINYYLKGLLYAFENSKLEIRDKYSFDLPPINDQNDWDALVSDLINNSEKFVKCIENIEETQLDRPFIEEKYGTLNRNIEGVIEHSYYHLGQISLIKKLLKE